MFMFCCYVMYLYWYLDIKCLFLNVVNHFIRPDATFYVRKTLKNIAT